MRRKFIWTAGVAVVALLVATNVDAKGATAASTAKAALAAGKRVAAAAARQERAIVKVERLNLVAAKKNSAANLKLTIAGLKALQASGSHITGYACAGSQCVVLYAAQ